MTIGTIQNNFTCPECKSNLDQVISTKNSSIKHHEFTFWGDDIIGTEESFIYDHKAKMYFPSIYHRSTVLSLFTWTCKVCPEPFYIAKDVGSLKRHIKDCHNMHMCSYCLENRQSFPSEHKVYTQYDFDKHLRSGDNDGSIGHPFCEFCRVRYYDKDQLFMHLRK